MKISSQLPGSLTTKPLMYKEAEISVRESATSTTMEEEIWNMDISDILSSNDYSSCRRPSLDGILNFSSSSPMSTDRKNTGSHRSRRSKRFQNTLSNSEHTARNHRRRSQGRPPKRSVSFDKVKIRVFERVLADNPPSNTGGGPSLGLGWKYTEKEAVDLDQFEITKQQAPPSSSIKLSSMLSWHSSRSRSSSPSKQHHKSLLMSAEKREKLAKKLGFSNKEIQTNIKMVDQLLKQRQDTECADAVQDARLRLSLVGC